MYYFLVDDYAATAVYTPAKYRSRDYFTFGSQNGGVVVLSNTLYNTETIVFFRVIGVFPDTSMPASPNSKNIYPHLRQQPCHLQKLTKTGYLYDLRLKHLAEHQ